MSSAMGVLLGLTAVLLTVAAVLVLVRMVLGPTMLDRAISFDVLAAVVLAAIGLHIAATDDAESVPVLLVLTLLAFVGSVSIARFYPDSDHTDAEREDDLDEDLEGRLERRLDERLDDRSAEQEEDA